MTEFVDQDLTGSSFRNVDLSGSTFRRVDLSRTDLRGVDLRGATVRGSELVDVRISAELQNVVVNGVDIAPLVEAELNRRDPERVLMRPSGPDGFRAAWAVLERRWAQTVDRARALPPDDLHRSVDDEWSFVSTLRHLGFAHAAWVSRMVLGVASPWHPLDLPWDEAPGWDGIPWDREARPSLDEVLVVRRERHATMRETLDALTEEQLDAHVSRTAPGWPRLEDFPLRECLLIVLNEEWEHRLYAERDLDALEEGR